MDSWEERYFSWYLAELVKKGFVVDYFTQQPQFPLTEKKLYKQSKQLKTKVKVSERVLLKSHVYTPDFVIVWAEKARGIFYVSLEDVVPENAPYFFANATTKEFLKNRYEISNDLSIIDVKPEFDQKNMTRLFRINQKHVFDYHDIYVQEVVPEKLFAKTFTPERYLVTNKSFKGRKIKFRVKTSGSYINERKRDIKEYTGIA